MKNRLLRSYILPHAPALIPDIGRSDHKYCSKTCLAMKKVAEEVKELNPKRIVIVSPHGALFSDAISVSYFRFLEGDFKNFGHEEIKVSIRNDIPFIDKLSIMASKNGITLAKLDDSLLDAFELRRGLDYGVSVPLYFIEEEYLKDEVFLKERPYEVVCMTYGLLPVESLYAFGMALRDSVESSEKDTVFIASGDLSHCLSESGPYTFSKYGQFFDDTLIRSLQKSDPFSFLTYPIKDRELAQTCCFQSVSILYGLYDRRVFKSDIYSYEAPFGVGYLVSKLEEVLGISPSLQKKLIDWQIEKKQNIRILEDDYIRLARDTVEYFVINKKRPFWDRGSYKIAPIKASCFVTLKNDSGLRSCVGMVQPRRSDLFNEIVSTAVSVCTDDNRFDDIDKSELSDLYVSVDVLSPLEEINGILDLDPKVFGIVVESGPKKGVLLPGIEGINNPADQLDIALKKAGIKEYEEYTLKRFSVERHEVDY